MKRTLAVAGVLCAGWLVAAAYSGAPALRAPGESRSDSPTMAPDYQDFVFFAESRPVLIRVHAEIDGRPLETAWNGFIDRLFAHVDQNGDGKLSRQELERAPTPQSLFNGGGRGIGFALVNGRGQPNPYLTGDDGPQWDREKFAAVFRRIGGAPFQMQDGSAPAMFAPGGQAVFLGGPQAPAASADAVTDAFFELLDTNKDGKLSREELAAAPELLMKLDADEDETVSINELLRTPAAPTAPYGVKFAGAMPAPQPAPPSLLFQVGQPGGGEAGILARELQQRYGPKNVKADDKTLSRQDIGLDQRTFDRLDADKDGRLDFEELAAFAKRPADVELRVRLGKRPRDADLIEVRKDDKNPSPLADAVRAESGTAVLELGNTRLDLRGIDAPMQQPPDILRQQYLAQFKAADNGNKGYLTEEEATNNRLFRNVFKAMDRDGDGKLYEKEVIAYLDAMKDLQSAAAAGCATVSFSDNGQGLFDLIDLNHDGRISLREMRQMVKLIDRLDKDGDGKISRSEVPRSYQAVFSEGPASTGAFNGAFVVVKGFAGPQPERQPPAPTAGPLWFRKMDRNHDGDVSRKEFLGTDDEFKRLDLDGDGLISLEEAMKAEAALRKEKP